ncbi:MAG: acyl-CoA dehydrogenase C-terminal domain-containing protein, partial [Gammaproteobacteria bacterium]|nr:acyl-CoA dehydrogenase C-terminal domain-containing protein [Gammaproteobacteria bacterium]
DMRFVLHEVLNAEESLKDIPDFADTSAELMDSVLDEAAKLFENVIFPTNMPGHSEGAVLKDGAVTTPAGFKEAYKAYAEGGWGALSSDPEYGGQGLPETLNFFLIEMFCASNVALSLYPGLTHGAYTAIHAHGTEALKEKYLPNLVSGQWTGTMCLTESHCGTDLGLLRTKAEPLGDDKYAITGTKIFITGGEHDLTDNIVHLVLARLPDAPAGVKGISLFLVPKFLVNDDGSLGERNAAQVQNIEHKMGIRGSATCVMQFDGAEGYLVGEPHRGLNCMFTMMNHERLAVGIQGLGLGEIAYQSAVAYARERVQGRGPNGPEAADKPADPIMVHPDVRRMLLTTRAYNEAARALTGWVALRIDQSERHPDPAVREKADDRVSLLTPVIKAFFTDHGMDATNRCLQVFGGAGYIAETGMEQLVRDARIAPIYEGTNGVQAMDLVGRKLFMHDGRLIKGYLAEMREAADTHGADSALSEFVQPFTHALSQLEQATEWLVDAAHSNPAELGAAAYDYMGLVAHVACAHMWVEMAKTAMAGATGDNTGFYDAKLATARFFMQRLMPATGTLYDAIVSGADTLMALEADAY